MSHEEGFVIPFNVLGLDLSINQAVVIMWGTCLFVFLYGWEDM